MELLNCLVSELNGKKTGMKRIKRIFQILQEERELYGELKTKHNFSTQHNMIKGRILKYFGNIYILWLDDIRLLKFFKNSP